MKKTISLILVLLLAIVLMAGCSSSGGSNGSGGSSESNSGSSAAAAAVESAKTMADVLGYEERGSSFYDDRFIYGFEVDGTVFKAKAELPSDVSEKLWALEFDDPDYDAKRNELVGPLEIKELVNITELTPAQEELDAWVGKTGAEIFDDGWTEWGYNLEDMVVYMQKEYFAYQVAFEYEGEQLENTDDFDIYEAVKDLKIKSVTLDGIGDPAYDEEAI